MRRLSSILGAVLATQGLYGMSHFNDFQTYGGTPKKFKRSGKTYPANGSKASARRLRQMESGILNNCNRGV